MRTCFLCDGSQVVELRYKDNGRALEPYPWGAIAIWSYCPLCVGWVKEKPTAAEIAAARAPCAPRQTSLWDNREQAQVSG